jgi:hypothetical protein
MLGGGKISKTIMLGMAWWHADWMGDTHRVFCPSLNYFVTTLVIIYARQSSNSMRSLWSTISSKQKYMGVSYVHGTKLDTWDWMRSRLVVVRHNGQQSAWVWISVLQLNLARGFVHPHLEAAALGESRVCRDVSETETHSSMADTRCDVWMKP